jgi:aminoglycoside phosphotransferase (APT) family kinase protein
MMNSAPVFRIAAMVGISVDQIIPLGQGATSAAWRLTTRDDTLIIRLIAAGTNRPATFQSEFTILRMLRAAGCPAPEPIMHSGEMDLAHSTVLEPWAITRLIPGAPLQNTPIWPQLAHDVGRVLSIVHTLPVHNFGRLVEQPAGLLGQQTDPLAGVLSRWCWAVLWPFDGSPFTQHPLAQIRPALAPPIQALAERLVEMLVDEPSVLTHSDLHGEHIFTLNGSLTGIIDFGAAFIGLPAWDFAVMAFYHGWPAAQTTIAGYTASSQDQQHLLRQTQRLALIVGLYKLDRAVKAQAPATKVDRIVQFISQTLAAMP